jgi:hypothetical protein
MLFCVQTGILPFAIGAPSSCPSAELVQQNAAFPFEAIQPSFIFFYILGIISNQQKW